MSKAMTVSEHKPVRKVKLFIGAKIEQPEFPSMKPHKLSYRTI